MLLRSLNVWLSIQIVVPLFLTASLNASGPAGGVIYVDDDAPPGGDGTSWNSAYRYLHNALLDAASSGGAEIRIAQGTYYPDESESDPGGTNDPACSFNVPNGVDLLGGYAGLAGAVQDDRDIAAYETTLSGDLLGNDGPNFTNRADNCNHVLLFDGLAMTDPMPALLEGLTIRSGGRVNFTHDGGGISIRDISVTLRQCTVIDNQATVEGGGVSFDAGTLIIDRCLIQGNSAVTDSNSEGGGIYADLAVVTVTDTRFIGNHVDGKGGGLYAEGGSALTIHRCAFYDNHSNRSWGGGVGYFGSFPLIVTNSIFAGNGGGIGSGIGATCPTSVVSNCTIAFNGTVGIRLKCDSASVTNCIAWGNDDTGWGERNHIWVDDLIDAVNYCCIEDLTPDFDGVGNTGANPLFVDPWGADFIEGTVDDDLHLSAGSPCIDTGNPGFVPLPGETDFDGEARVIAGRVDIGMDEAFSVGEDCNNNGIPDATDIIEGTSPDCNANNVPDECDFAEGTSLDCNGNMLPDECDIAAGTSLDCNVNGVPDNCDISAGTSPDGNGNGVPDECDPPDPILARAGRKLYVGGRSKLMRFNLDGSGRVDLISDVLDAPFDVEVDASAGKIYWSDSFDHKIHRSNFDGTGKEVIISGLGEPYGIALDLTVGKIYWSDAGLGLLRRANLDGTLPETVLSQGLGEPRGIAVNPNTGTVYWVDAALDCIKSVDAEGVNVSTLLTSGLTDPVDIEVDAAGGKMYWSDSPAFETGVNPAIRRADLSGANVETLTTDGHNVFQPRFIALNLTTGKLYWTDAPTGNGNMWRMNFDGSVIQDLGPTGTGLEGIAVDPVGAKLYWASPHSSAGGRLKRGNLDATGIDDLDDDQFPRRYDVAVHLAGGRMYWTHDPFDLTPKQIRSASMHDGSDQVVLVDGGSQSVGDLWGIALRPAAGLMYWADRDGRVYRAGMDGSSATAYIDDNQLGLVRYVALDPIGNLIYISERSSNIWTANLNLGGVVTPFLSPFCPHGIALDRAGGKLYWVTECNGDVNRVNLDGTGSEALVSSSGSTGAEDIALDLLGGKMYWTSDDFIRRANLDGSDVEVIAASFLVGADQFFGLDIAPADCNCNGIGDPADIQGGASTDANLNGIPDECDDACNMHGVTDVCAISRGLSRDCNANGIPDECDLAALTSQDCNYNLIPDECDLGTALDTDANGVLDRCELPPTTCAGDLVVDGQVNVTDLLNLLAGWGVCPPPCSPGLVNDPDTCPTDIDRSCGTNIGDLLELLAAWGMCS